MCQVNDILHTVSHTVAHTVQNSVTQYRTVSHKVSHSVTQYHAVYDNYLFTPNNNNFMIANHGYPISTTKRVEVITVLN